MIADRAAALDRAVVVDHAGERIGERALSVALDAGDADDLAAAHVEKEVVEPRCAASGAEVADVQTSGSAASWRAAQRRARSPPTIARAIASMLVSPVSARADDLAVAHHRHARRVVDHFLQLVRHDHDRGAALRERHDRRKEALDLGGRERGRRLVEQEDGRFAIEFAQQLDALLHADRQRFDERVGIDLEAVALRRRRPRVSRAAASSMRQPRRGSRPSKTFCHTRSRPTSSKC